MSGNSTEQDYRELEVRVLRLETGLDALNDRVNKDGEKMNKIDEKYDAMRVDLAELKVDLQTSYQSSVNQIMEFFKENQRNEFELRKNNQNFIFKVLSASLGSGGLIWLLIDFLTKR